MADEDQVTLMSQDGQDFKMDVKTAKKSETIGNLIEDVGTDAPIPIPNITGKILAKIVEAMKVLTESQLDKSDKEGYINLLLTNLGDQDITAFLLAANYLDIKELLDQSVTFIATKLDKTGQYNKTALTQFRETEKLETLSDEDVFCRKLRTDKKENIPLDICKLIKKEFPKMQVACGEKHTMVITKDGILYGAGSNNNGELGNGFGGNSLHQNNNNVIKFIPIDINGKIITKVACSFLTTMVIAKDGILYGAGNNTHNQLGTGLGGEDKQELKFIPIDIAGKKIINVSCGSYHTMVITENNVLYGAGNNEFGQLGNGLGGTDKEELKFVPITIEGKKIMQIACGSEHTMAITEDGMLYGTGTNRYGQLGMGNIDQYIKFVPSFHQRKIVQVACGYYHTMIIMEGGILYGAGNNMVGQLGNGSNEENLNESKFFIFTASIMDKCEANFIPIDISGKKVIFVACGGLYTMIITEDGMLYATGDNEVGQLGFAQDKKKQQARFIHIDIAGKRIIYVACGEKHTMVITEDNILYGTGSNAFGQLGNGEGKQIDKFIPILTIPRQLGGSLRNDQASYYKKYLKYKTKYFQLLTQYKQ